MFSLPNSARPENNAALLSQLAMFLSLQEDLQCRLSLCQSRLTTLLQTVSSSQVCIFHMLLVF